MFLNAPKRHSAPEADGRRVGRANLLVQANCAVDRAQS
jgi:hypothetical protein